MTNQAYKDAGVDIDAGNALIDNIKPLAKKTHRAEVLGGLGGFGGCFSLDMSKYQHPVLVSGTDGVGTKLKLAFEMNQHHGIGIDLVAMCANDILTLGAEPLFFLDYYATGQLSIEAATDVVRGISEGCMQAGMSLLGGETAEMPGMYKPGEYDLAGFCVGVVEKSAILDNSNIQTGHVLVGIGSDGFHANGFSLIRKIIHDIDAKLNSPLGETTLGDALLTPTRIYVKAIQALLKNFNLTGMAHITGGGLIENIPRILPPGTKAIINTQSWPQTPLFAWLKNNTNLTQTEYYTTFNMGIGYVLALPAHEADNCVSMLETLGEKAFIIGEVAVCDQAQNVVLK